MFRTGLFKRMNQSTTQFIKQIHLAVYPDGANVVYGKALADAPVLAREHAMLEGIVLENGGNGKSSRRAFLI